MMFSNGLVLLSVLGVIAADVSHILNSEEHTTSTAPPPPKPYVFSYTAGRYPGHTDRHHAEVSDGTGVVKGTFSYVDPRNKVRKVDYVADKEGFHPVLNEEPPEHPRDSAAVARAKEHHHELYAKIAQEHAVNPHPDESSSPRETAAVALAAAKHMQLFRVIAEQHARIAAERELLQKEEELQHQHSAEHEELQHQHLGDH